MSRLVDDERIIEILFEMASQEETLKEVEKNFFNNTWWPLDIQDYRKRMIIAGLSSRISYNMINTYKKVCTELNGYTFEQICKLRDEEVIQIIKPLGLAESRVKYIKSMSIYLMNHTKVEIFDRNESELIEEISKNVYGASYKIAQCCVLYAKSYFCGIFPIDSGMKDILMPCLGFKQYGAGKGHEQLRQEITQCILDNSELFIQKLEDKYPIFFSDNSADKINVVIWWSHLVMIYFKRMNCNKKKGTSCLLHLNKKGINLSCIKK